MSRRRTPPTAVLDTSVIFLLLDPSKVPSEVEARKNAEAALRELITQGVKFIIPAPVLAELPADYAEVLFASLSGLRIEPFDFEAANKTRLLTPPKLKPRKGSRAALKFDTMIAGIAVNLGARYLLTADARDFGRLLKAAPDLKAPELLNVRLPLKGQGELFERQPQPLLQLVSPIEPK